MQKSLYQNKEFANYWDRRAGKQGEVYKRHVLDPLMLDLIGDLTNKTVLDVGCGNGYLMPNLLSRGASRIVLMDISDHNLSNAKRNHPALECSYVCHDVTTPWPLENDSIDVIYSNMLLNEVDDINTPISEAARVLKPNGLFAVSVTHPAWNLFEFAKKKYGVTSKKFTKVENYFYRGKTYYVMGVDSKTNPNLADKFSDRFEVEHYQRPVSDYFNELTQNNFMIEKMLEPEVNKALLEENPRFAGYADHPVGLIFYGKLILH